jgi:RNA polymerase sigma factor (sigma-70 family)
VTDIAWIDLVLRSARPQAVGALLRYFRDLDRAEEAFQEACLRALQKWPANGPPRDPVAWLVLVGRNVGLDDWRRSAKSEPLPADAAISNLDDADAELAERLDSSHYCDDVLRLLFICCHPDLPAVQQIALALRVVSGLTVKEIARAFLVSESAMEQRITRAKSRVAQADVPFEAPGPIERAERLGGVAAMIYLIFNEGYSASGGDAHLRVALCEEAIRLARLLLTMFASEAEIMGLTALLLLQHARARARLDADGAIILLEDQDRSRWDHDLIAEGLALIEKAVRHRRPGPISFRPQSPAFTRTRRELRIPTGRKSTGSMPRWKSCTLSSRYAQPRRCRQQGFGTRDRAGNDRAAGRTARRLFPFFRRKGRAFAAAWPHGRGAGRPRSGDRACRYAGRGGAHSSSSRPFDEGKPNA